MKKILLAFVLVLMLAVPAFATSWGDTYNDYDYTITNQGGAGGSGGSVGAISNQQSQGIGSGNSIVGPGSMSILSPSATGGSVGAITNTNTANGGAGGNATGGNAVNRVRIDNNPTIAPVITVKPEINTDIKNTNTNVGINTNINDVKNTNSNTIAKDAIKNTNTNINGQTQGQVQGQNNGQEIAPVQTTTIITERPFVQIPTVGVPEMNFGNGRMVDASKMLPKFKGVALLKDGDTIHTVVDVVANVPFKKLYKTILTLAKDNAVQAPYMRFQIIRAEGQKSWTTGGALSGGGSGMQGASGVAGGGSLIPSIGGTKAHDLFTIVVVNVIPE